MVAASHAPALGGYGKSLRLLAPAVAVTARVGDLLTEHGHLDGRGANDLAATSDCGGRCVTASMTIQWWKRIARTRGRRFDPYSAHHSPILAARSWRGSLLQQALPPPLKVAVSLQGVLKRVQHG